MGADLLGFKARLMIIFLNKRQIAEMISPEIEKPVGGILKIYTLSCQYSHFGYDFISHYLFAHSHFGNKKAPTLTMESRGIPVTRDFPSVCL